jgi:prepilin-type N-terminal cleavage/methylation domain-containing protein
MKNKKSGGFTLIELLIVIAILAVLATAAVLMLNPAQMLAESNDSTRLNDIRTLDNAISLSNVTGSITDSTASKLVYISLPSTDDDVVEDCINDYPSLPPLASGWTYRCAVSNTNKADLRKIDSSGWLPINLSSSQPPLAALPIDPMNNATNYYAYGYDSNKEKYAIASVMASTKHLDTTAAKDGGNWDVAYEIRPVEWIGGGSAATFIKTFGGLDGDYTNSVARTSDGGYVVTGRTESFGAINYDVLLLKFDSSNNLTWSKTFGGAMFDEGDSVVQTSDGGYIVVGYTYSFGPGDDDVLLLKFDSSGNLSWSKTINNGGLQDVGTSVAQTSDGGYIVTGYSVSVGPGVNDALLLKFDSSGNLSWSKTFGGGGNDMGTSVAQTSDGGYIVTGRTNSFGAGGNDALLSKFDSSGNLSWSKTVGGPGFDMGYSVAQTSDGGYIITGETQSFGAGGGDALLLKFDSSGNLSWSKTFGGTSYDGGHSVTQTSDGGYIVSGQTFSFGAGNYDVLLSKFDSSGNLSWSKTAGGASFEWGDSVTQVLSGDYIVAGYTQSFGAGNYDGLLLKFDSLGDISSCSSVENATLISSSPVFTALSPVFITSSPAFAILSPALATSLPPPAMSMVCPL